MSSEGESANHVADIRYDIDLQEGPDYTTYPDPSLPGRLVRVLTSAGRLAYCRQIRAMGPPRDWPAPIRKYIEEHGIPPTALPGRAGFEFMLVSSLALHPEYVFSRDDLYEMRQALAEWFLANPNHSPRPRATSLSRVGDVIQAVNKSGQWGLPHQTIEGALGGRPGPFYRLVEPFRYDASARRLREAQPLDPGDREASRQRTLDYLYENFFSVPAAEWDQGHVRPSDESPGVWQPRSYQRSRKDRFMFDEFGLVLSPTATELAANLDKYYTDEELALIAAAISARLAGTGSDSLPE